MLTGGYVLNGLHPRLLSIRTYGALPWLFCAGCLVDAKPLIVVVVEGVEGVGVVDDNLEERMALIDFPPYEPVHFLHKLPLLPALHSYRYCGYVG